MKDEAVENGYKLKSNNLPCLIMTQFFKLIGKILQNCIPSHDTYLAETFLSLECSTDEYMERRLSLSYSHLSWRVDDPG